MSVFGALQAPATYLGFTGRAQATGLFFCRRSILMDRYLLELELASATGGAAGAATASLISMAQRGNA
jgi:hypothetical protein